ncbi:MAG: sulfurtransferase TusA [Pseudomonadota bacterium]|nr:sulfurtransferase TusA [Pseudomonadota bacterium]
MTETADYHFDASGLMCPEPVMMLHGKVREMAGGETLEVVATDPSTQRDIPKFCQFLGHELILSEEQDGKYVFRIRKKPD